MKAITLTQPWACLVAVGAKRIETRSWSTYYRGPLAIHAAKGGIRKRDVTGFWREEPFLSALYPGGNYIYPELLAGSILATCRLVDCVQMGRWSDCIETAWPVNISEHNKMLTPTEVAFGDFYPDRYAWILEDVVPLSVPIPAKGALGLWDWDR